MPIPEMPPASASGKSPAATVAGAPSFRQVPGLRSTASAWELRHERFESPKSTSGETCAEGCVEGFFWRRPSLDSGRLPVPKYLES